MVSSDRNGAGKTTLLLILAGLLKPDSGTIELGNELLDSQALRQRTGWMPDVFGTWDSLTAQEILITFGRLYGQTNAQARTRAAELLDLVHLNEFADKPAHVLSRGQKQRLGFARALVHRPQLLLLDEPASGMDPRSRLELRDQLRALASQGCTIVVSSHILGELEEMIDDVVLMTQGQTQTASPTTESVWRIRLVGQPAAEAQLLPFTDDTTAAAHLGKLISNGAQVAEFARTESGLEAAYLALDPVRQ